MRRAVLRHCTIFPAWIWGSRNSPQRDPGSVARAERGMEQAITAGNAISKRVSLQAGYPMQFEERGWLEHKEDFGKYADAAERSAEYAEQEVDGVTVIHPAPARPPHQDPSKRDPGGREPAPDDAARHALKQRAAGGFCQAVALIGDGQGESGGRHASETAIQAGEQAAQRSDVKNYRPALTQTHRAERKH